jgi:hypothetical protein
MNQDFNVEKLQEIVNKSKNINELIEKTKNFRNNFKKTTEFINIISNFVIKTEEEINKDCIELINFIHKNQVQIKQSEIPGAGYGLFADKDFKKGEIICAYGGYLTVTKKIYDYEDNFYDLTSYFLEQENDRKKLHFIQDSRIFFKLSEPGRFPNSVPWGLNQMCHYKNKCIYNNAKFKKNEAQKSSEKPVSSNIIAARDILKGEEIYCQYGQEYQWHRIPFMIKLLENKSLPRATFRLPSVPKEAFVIPQNFDLNKELFKNITLTLDSPFGVIEQLIIYMETLYDVMHKSFENIDFYNIFFANYFIKKDDFYKKQTNEVLYKYQNYLSLTEFLKIQDDYSVVAETEIPENVNCTTFGGIITNVDLFYNNITKSIPIPNHVDWFIYPYKIFKFTDFGNFADWTSDINQSNCELIMSEKDFIIHVRTTKEIKKNERIIIHIPGIEKSPNCEMCEMESKNKKAKAMDSINNIYFCGEQCFQKYYNIK